MAGGFVGVAAGELDQRALVIDFAERFAAHGRVRFALDDRAEEGGVLHPLEGDLADDGVLGGAGYAREQRGVGQSLGRALGHHRVRGRFGDGRNGFLSGESVGRRLPHRAFFRVQCDLGEGVVTVQAFHRGFADRHVLGLSRDGHQLARRGPLHRVEPRSMRHLPECDGEHLAFGHVASSLHLRRLVTNTAPFVGR